MVVVAVEYYVYQLSPFGQVRFVWLGEKHQRLCVCQFKIISTPCCCNLYKQLLFYFVFFIGPMCTWGPIIG